MLEHQVLLYIADLLLSWRPSTKIEHKRGIQNTLLDAARARGRRGGRLKAIQKIEPRNLLRAKELYAARKNTIQEIMTSSSVLTHNATMSHTVARSLLSPWRTCATSPSASSESGRQAQTC